MEFFVGQGPEVGMAIQVEYDHQQRNIEPIASENFVSPTVLFTAATVLTNKYAEGYPDKRCYGGCQCVDMMEGIACKRVCQLFGANHVNVWPYCGANANYVMYAVLYEHDNTALGMDLANGGHLTHDSPTNFSGKNYNIVAYGVDGQGCIDYDQVCDLAKEHRSYMLPAGASAYPRTIGFRTPADITHEVGAYLFMDMTYTANLVAVGLHPFPAPYAGVVTATTHKTLRGPRGDIVLHKGMPTRKTDPTTFLGSQGDPLEYIIAAKAVALGEAIKPEFKAYREQILKNAVALARALMAEGLGLVSGGTGNHLMLVDFRPARLTGKEMERRLDEANVIASKNAIPNDPERLFVTSDIRVDTPTATTRGFKEMDTEAITSIMWCTATDLGDRQNELRAQVAQLIGKYPLYE